MATQRKTRNKKLFISWSGDNSKEIALKLKFVFESTIFGGSKLECFVSDIDITSGEDWWLKIKRELTTCELGIAVVTKENLGAPWLYFESGAIIAKDKLLIPLLFNCNYKKLEHTPLALRQAKNFYDYKQFREMVLNINLHFQKLQCNDDALEKLIADGYSWLKKEIEPITKKLKNMRVFSESYVYPVGTNIVNKNTVFVSAPMASISPDDYSKLYDFIASLTEDLKSIGFIDVVSPVVDNKDPKMFEGSVVAINKNYPKLKSVESMIVIIPKTTSFTSISSIWVDIGYCLALSKNIVIFYEDDLPYMLKDAGSYISHVHTHKYYYDATGNNPYESIRETIKRSGLDLFRPANIMEDIE